MNDFTLSIYKQLLETLIKNKYNFLTVEEYFRSSLSRTQSNNVLLMRHDVDRKPQNALRMAKLEHDLGIKATYYFRTIPKTFKSDIIKEIAELGHEIAYHYENLAETNGNYELAIKDFEKNLAELRKIVPIKNIAMHGSPMSKWDSRDLWKKYNYKDYGITSEPYFDINFDKVLYITDAGRSWDNATINLRDKVESLFKSDFKNTNDIISALKVGKLSNQIMINIHPEHWAESNSEWFKIWFIRKVKNNIKKVIIGRRARRGKSDV